MEIQRAPAAEWVPRGRLERGAEIVQLAFGGTRYMIGGIAVLVGMLVWLSIVFARHHFHHPGHATWCEVANFTVSVGGGRGGGHFTTVSAAVDAAPDFSARRFCIHVKEGRYLEKVVVGENKTNIVLVGDGIGKTIISGSDGEETATLWVRGHGFMASDMTVENNNQNPPRSNGSTAAIDNRSHRSVLLRCRFMGYHGAVIAYDYSQLYRECQIDGAGYLVSGGATAVFQNCSMSLLATAPESRFVMAAHSRDKAYTAGVFVFHLSELSITGGSTTNPPPVFAFPSGAYARIAYIQCVLGFEAGWSRGNFTATSPSFFFGTYENRGVGASKFSNSSSQVINFLDQAAASRFSVRKLFGKWLPGDVPVYLDLL